ncbi:MAG: hypothetical protein ACYC5O_15305 [Anaerolineae bacterium]
MAQPAAIGDVKHDAPREGDANAERIGEFDESRCKPAPPEVRAQVDEALGRAFPAKGVERV